MNKTSLITLGRKLQDENLYVLSVHDLEPKGIIVHAYDQINSTEYILPISEYEFINAGYSRNHQSLSNLLDTIELIEQGPKMVLQSSNASISKPKRRLLGDELKEKIHGVIPGSSETMTNLLTTGLVELCKVKPTGLDAVEWLVEWLISNNPNKPVVEPCD